MGLLEAALTRIRIWDACWHLSAQNSAERDLALHRLRAEGRVSLPSLRYAITHFRSPRAQCGAAIALHWLGDPQGMAMLIDALRWRLASDPAIASEVEAALITIGAPDAVTATLDLWPQLPNYESDLALHSICSVWQRLRDRRALDALTARADRIPDLFVQTVPAFGEMAIDHLARMLHDPEPLRRLLAVNCLGRIRSWRAFSALEPLLRHPDPALRAAVPQALESAGSAPHAAKAICAALEAGYSTREAIEALERSGTVPGETLLALITRWNPASIGLSQDTPDAVLAALAALGRGVQRTGKSTLPPLIPPLCAFLERRPTAAMAAAAARVLKRCERETEHHSWARRTLCDLLTWPDADVRAESADALLVLEEPLGRQLLQRLTDCQPQGNLLDKVQTILRGGPDAGQAATLAVQQVSQWISRLSRETVERWNQGAGGPGVTAGSYDSRLPDLLRRLLMNALDALQAATTPGVRDGERIALGVAAIRALGRLAPPDALSARDALLRALHFVKHGMVYVGTPTGPFSLSDVRDVGVMVRLAAAETLTLCYGEASFALFLEALYAPQPEIRGTAIAALGQLGDRRALPLLQPFAAEATHPLALVATEAIAAIKRTNPELMTLLRASSAGDTRPDTLLRPASGNPDATAPDLLLRPTAQHPHEPHDAPITD